MSREIFEQIYEISKHYEILFTPINRLRLNLNNPRSISESRFKQLVQSIKDSPWMLKLRPIVTNEYDDILGGNQRFKACLEAGLTHVWTMRVKGLTKEQEKRFILRDNIGFGKWDLEIIRKQYNEAELLKYGAEIELLESKQAESDSTIKPPPIMEEEDIEPEISEDELDQSKKNFNENTIKQIVFQLPSDIYEQAVNDLDSISKTLDLNDNSEVLIHLINYYEVSNGLKYTNNDSLEG